MNFPLEFYNHRNQKVILHEKCYKRHLERHFMLSDPEFIKGHLKKTIKDPDEIYESLNNERCHCYYKYHYYIDDRNGRWIYYTKVVILVLKHPPQIIKTAFSEKALNLEAIREIKKLWIKQNLKI